MPSFRLRLSLMSMNLLRSVALIVLAMPLCLPAAVAQAAQPTVQAGQGGTGNKPAATSKPAAKSKPAANKRKGKAKTVSKEVKQPLPKAKLDLSLPTHMVEELDPAVGDATLRRKPILPAMFPDKAGDSDSPFQLNGRLISNEMQLQLRNDSRRDVEGAAIEFQFRN